MSLCRSLILWVFPAYAGVFLMGEPRSSSAKCLPRIRGGVSPQAEPCRYHARSSPHTRGCFYAALRALILPGGLPRIRGGVSYDPEMDKIIYSSSPHTRGCFSRIRRIANERNVFPAYAGVFPFLRRHGAIRPCLPSIRGGVSPPRLIPHLYVKSSPHTRGCFCRLPYRREGQHVFPAYAGVFLPVHFG